MQEHRRNGTVDLLRGVGALGVVWFHSSAPGGEYGLAGLTVLFLLFLLYAPDRDQPFGPVLVSRIDRLLRPWIVWSLVLSLAKILQALVGHHPLTEEFALWMLLTGPGLYLWFLPFAFACVAMLLLVERKVDLGTSTAFIIIMALVVVCLPISTWARMGAGGPPMPEWSAAIAPVMIGVGLRSSGESGWRQAGLLAATLASSLLNLMLNGQTPVGVPLGLVATIAALHLRLPDTPTLRWIGWVAMPVYLAHPIFLAMLGQVAPQLDPILLAMLAVVLSAVTGETIRRLGLAARLL